MDIDELKIIKFRGLNDLPELKFNLINVIASPGNFGKTSLLQAIYASIGYDRGEHIMETAAFFKNSRCRDFDCFKQLLTPNKDGTVEFNISSRSNGIEIRKHLIGKFKNAKTFNGKYFVEAENENLQFFDKKEIDTSFYRDRKICTDPTVIYPECAYFDFDSNYRPLPTGLKDSEMRAFAVSYLNWLDNNIIGVFMREHKFWIRHHTLGNIPAEMFGDAPLKVIEFCEFCCKNKGKILFVDNADSFYPEPVWKYYCKMLLAILTYADSQVFITARSRKFAEYLVSTMKSVGCYDSINYINIGRNEDDLTTIDCEIGYNTRMEDAIRKLTGDCTIEDWYD